VKLTEYLLKSGPGKNWASRVFYTDNGSTGMEVALKMALKLSATRSGQLPGHDSSIRVICQTGSYHGDTLGTMLAAEPNEYNNNQHAWYKPKAFSIPLPYISYKKGVLSVHTDTLGGDSTATMTEVFPSISNVMDVQARLKSDLHIFYSKFVEQYLDTHTSSAKVYISLLTYLQSIYLLLVLMLIIKL
jgi:dethiobiotin synthetase/adenosylmethionine--8-amino-7-oxononanoate aminotransferase